MKSVITVIFLIFCFAFLAFGVPYHKVPDVKKVKKTAEAVKAGLVVYNNKCRICHENSYIDMSKKSYTVMMPLLASMVEMEKLNKKDVEHVAAYVYSVSKK